MRIAIRVALLVLCLPAWDWIIFNTQEYSSGHAQAQDAEPIFKTPCSGVKIDGNWQRIVADDDVEVLTAQKVIGCVIGIGTATITPQGEPKNRVLQLYSVTRITLHADDRLSYELMLHHKDAVEQIVLVNMDMHTDGTMTFDGKRFKRSK